MKLKNKETGEIGKIAKTKTDDEEIEIITDTKVYLYKSLSEVCQHWEDYEEPKEDYTKVITSFIHYVEEADDSFCCDESVKKFAEKLKAWKRLEDKGFKFKNNSLDICCHTINFKVDTQFDMTDETSRDLHILFGGEE